jgi:hypothetical protein
LTWQQQEQLSSFVKDQAKRPDHSHLSRGGLTWQKRLSNKGATAALDDGLVPSREIEADSTEYVMELTHQSLGQNNGGSSHIKLGVQITLLI